MQLKSVTSGGFPPTTATKLTNWLDRVAFAKILIILICLTLCVPCRCAKNSSDGEQTRNHATDLYDIEGEKVPSCQIADIAELICETRTESHVNVPIRNVIGNVRDENQDAARSMSEEQSLHRAPNTVESINPSESKEYCSGCMIESCKLGQCGKDVERFTHASVQNAARSEGQMKCRCERHHRLDGSRAPIDHTRTVKTSSDDYRGLLNSITLDKLPQALYIAYRAPFVMLKHHFALYERFEESVIWHFNHYVQEPLAGFYKSCSYTFYSCARNIVHKALAQLTVQLKARAMLKGEYMAMNVNLEDFMREEHNVHQHVFITKDAKLFSIRNIAAQLYRTTGIKHCIYWWHAITRNSKRRIQGNYTLPKLLTAIYGNKTRLIIKGCEVYLLWVTFSTGYLFLENLDYSEDIHDVEASVKEIFGSLAPSPFAIKRFSTAVYDAVIHLVACADHKMELFYGHLSCIYPEFELLLPQSRVERIGVTLALLFFVYTVLWFILATIRALLGIICIVVRGVITLRFAYVAYDKLKRWYDNSFLRWSFDLLQTEKNDIKSQSLAKGRMKMKNMHAANPQTDHPTVNRRKGADCPKKSVALWHGVSRRSRLTESVVNESNKDR
ncbi:retinoic acid receptor responder 3-like protein [Babesia ovata]|uniref:Retinoic acid receptor responder 3-like protein n=1 Tax=Babesia ovata TaxID=189622 RepID=A0A2H6KI98_9APIC|nr:retinoic acid receptor responder 3-like protein [Babesia ovata]GBE62715.1 retinoic acid receptor responder 3-like protein [Babesia ovata]